MRDVTERESKVTEQSQKTSPENASGEGAANAVDGSGGAASHAFTERPPSFAGLMFAALYAGVLASFIVGIGEFLLTVILSAAPSHGGWWPADLVLAAAGCTVATYLLFSLPTLLACGVLYWFYARRRADAVPEAFFLALFLLLAALVAFPGWVELIARVNDRLLIPGIILGAALAALIRFSVRRMHQRIGPRQLRRFFIITCGCAALATIGLGFFFVRSPLFNPGIYRVADGMSRTRTPRSPHVLWIVLDTLRADRLGVYGYDKPTTPFLNKWAEQALVFDRVVADGMWTLPSHTSMFTGLPVRTHGMGGPTTRLDDSYQTAAEVLAENGYQTALFSNNPLVGPQTNLSQGFQTTRVPWEFLREMRCSLEFFCERWGITPPTPWLDPGFGAALTNELAARWLDNAGPAPIFVFVNYMECHLPYSSTTNYRRQFLTPEEVDRSYDLRRRLYGEISDFLTFDANIDGYERVAPSDRELLKRMYDASVRNLDARVEELIDIFRTRGLLDDTLVVITADHGEHLETHGMWSHHFLLYDDLIHVPMIIRPPGGVAPQRFDTVVQLSDLYPTILHAALGPEVGGGQSDARDLLEIAGQGAPDRVAVAHMFGARPRYVERLLESDDLRVRHRASSQTAAVDARFKYVHSQDGVRELFDTIADPGELTNLAQSNRAEMRRLDDYLETWLRKTPEYMSKEGGAAIEPEVMNLLQALGYIQEED